MRATGGGCGGCKCWADAERNGTRVKLDDTPGAARVRTQTVAEMAVHSEEARASAAAADKGKMTRVPAPNGGKQA